MSRDEDRHSGIPTRAIHEAYLDMQRALANYRRAQDRNGGSLSREHGELQSTVLTFYELLRPHIRSNSAVADYWEGKLPNYTGENEPPDPADGTAVLAVQTHQKTLQKSEVKPPDHNTLSAWDDAVPFNGNTRVAGVRQNGNVILVRLQMYELGLRKLDTWRTEHESTQTEIGGFLGGARTQEKQRRRVVVPKLRRAARELSDVAEDLGALSEFDASTPRTEITEELMEDIDKWRKQQGLE